MDYEQTSEPWYPIPPDPDEQENPDPPDEPETWDGFPHIGTADGPSKFIGS